MLPQDIRDALRGLYPDSVLDNTQLEVTVPRLTGFMVFTLIAPQKWLAIGSAPSPGLIRIHPSYYAPKTATGLALIGHELCHQVQWQTVPNFLAAYTAEEERNIAGHPPWSNRFEAECYASEQRAATLLRQRGYPSRQALALPFCMCQGSPFR
ncbi:MAG: hypothetical protein V1724_06350 [Chloroflexota bacterium]